MPTKRFQGKAGKSQFNPLANTFKVNPKALQMHLKRVANVLQDHLRRMWGKLERQGVVGPDKTDDLPASFASQLQRQTQVQPATCKRAFISTELLIVHIPIPIFQVNR